MQEELKSYLFTQQQLTAQSLGKAEENLQKARARQKTAEFATY